MTYIFSHFLRLLTRRRRRSRMIDMEFKKLHARVNAREITVNGVTGVIVKLISGFFDFRMGHIDGPSSGDYKHIKDTRKFVSTTKN